MANRIISLSILSFWITSEKDSIKGCTCQRSKLMNVLNKINSGTF